MSNPIPNRKPAWEGEIGDMRPSFNFPVELTTEQWLCGPALQGFIEGDIQICGALRPPEEKHTGHFLVHHGSDAYVAHVKTASGGDDLQIAAEVADYLDCEKVPVCRYRRQGCGRVERRVDGLSVTLTNYFPARHRAPTTADAIVVGELVARMHSRLSTFPRAEDVRRRTGFVISHLQNIQNRLANGVVSAVPESQRDAVAKAAISYRPDFNFGLPNQCVHGDVSPGNVLFLENGSAVLCDFEDAAFCYRSPVFDLGMAILRFGLEGVNGTDDSTSVDRAEELLTAYSRWSTVMPDRPILIAGIRNCAYHAYMVLSSLAINGTEMDAGEWGKPAAWLELIDTWDID